MPASAAVQIARGMRAARDRASDVRIEWYINEVCSKISMTITQRVRIATEYVRSRTVGNVSRPVTKTKIKRSRPVINKTTGKRSYSRTVVSNRSKGGEFPKADTTQLMKSLFCQVIKLPNGAGAEGFVGTPLYYGLILEVSKRLNRSFLARTLREENSKVLRILTGPIK